MSVVLLDTTVASLLHPKKQNDTRRASYEPHMQGQILALSFQSVAELWQWAEENNWGSHEKQRLETFVQEFLIIPYDVEIAKAWARLNVHCKKIGRRLEAGDAWIAAAAIRFNLPLLTHDKDFTRLHHQQLHVVSYA